jgi:hypothetical protein
VTAECDDGSCGLCSRCLAGDEGTFAPTVGKRGPVRRARAGGASAHWREHHAGPYADAREEHAARLAWDNEHPNGDPFPGDEPAGHEAQTEAPRDASGLTSAGPRAARKFLIKPPEGMKPIELTLRLERGCRPDESMWGGDPMASRRCLKVFTCSDDVLVRVLVAPGEEKIAAQEEADLAAVLALYGLSAERQPDP